MVDLVLLAAPRSFCAGVEMAIKALAWMVQAFEPPVYCYHEIVHNKIVVERFENIGVIFVNDIDEVPEGMPIMLSAHGSAPEVIATAEERGSYLVDAVCPLVTKVHHEVKTRANKGYQIIYVGHENHEEAVGTMAVAPEVIHRVDSVEDVEVLPSFSEPVAILTQTTLSQSDWEGVLSAAEAKIENLWQPSRSDLCFATTNRQSALINIAPHCDAIIVIGSANSSNTCSLVARAKETGCPRVYRVNNAEEVPDDLRGTIGVTAGASAPEEQVRAVIDTLAPTQGIKEVRLNNETVYFPLPRNLRALVNAIDSIGVTFGLDYGCRPRLNDRTMDASQVLSFLDEEDSNLTDERREEKREDATSPRNGSSPAKVRALI